MMMTFGLTPVPVKMSVASARAARGAMREASSSTASAVCWAAARAVRARRRIGPRSEEPPLAALVPDTSLAGASAAPFRPAPGVAWKDRNRRASDGPPEKRGIPRRSAPRAARERHTGCATVTDSTLACARFRAPGSPHPLRARARRLPPRHTSTTEPSEATAQECVPVRLCRTGRGKRSPRAMRSAAPQHPERRRARELVVVARRERAPVDLDRRLTAVGRVREEVVDREDPASRQMRRPRLVVAVGRLVRVSAVDEDQAERHRPEGGGVAAPRDDQDRGRLEIRRAERSPELGQRLDGSGDRVEYLRVVVLLAR